MNAPLDTAIAVDVYRQRRERVLAALRAAGGGVAIVPTAPEMLRNRDTAYPYRFDSYFHYLTGFTEPDAVLVLNAAAPHGAPESILFCRAKNVDREIWEGFHYGPEAARDAFGRVDVLVNCAGVAPGEKVVGRDGPHSLDRFARAVSINLVGTFNMIRLAAEAMSKQDADAEGERGVIVNTASVAAFDGQIGQAAYAASKSGVVGMTLPIARELARFGIRVVTVAPGIFATPMMAGMPQDVQDALGKSVPFPPRLGRPEEFAALVRHIAENTMLNGEVIRLDGALRMAPR